ncbi:MAG: zinc ABC transporter substrate-binding protein [Pseudomonadota bacterium]
MVERVGGEHVSVTTLVGPDGDAHVYQPTPADARAVSEAQVVIVNGLEFEGWLDRLIDASGFQGTPVVATAGIEPIPFEEAGDDHDDHDDHAGHGHGEKHAGHGHDDHGHDHGHSHGHDHGAKHAGHDDHGHDDHGHAGHDHGAFDPHAWQSIVHAVRYVENITTALSAADPANAAAFAQNRDAYVAELSTLHGEILGMMGQLADSQRTVVTSHDAFGYFTQAYGVTFIAPQGLSTASEASAQDVARLIEQIREEAVSAVFVESITDNRLIEQIARETGAQVGGTLYSDALSGPDGPASTYIDMMRHNAALIAQTLGS